jgi:hypothetical protein
MHQKSNEAEEGISFSRQAEESRKAEEAVLLPRQVEEICDQEKGLIVKETQDIENLLEENHADRTSGNNGYSAARTWRRIGSIPNIFIEQAMRETGINIYAGGPDAERLLRKILQEHYKFRTVDKL